MLLFLSIMYHVRMECSEQNMRCCHCNLPSLATVQNVHDLNFSRVVKLGPVDRSGLEPEMLQCNRIRLLLLRLVVLKPKDEVPRYLCMPTYNISFFSFLFWEVSLELPKQDNSISVAQQLILFPAEPVAKCGPPDTLSIIMTIRPVISIRGIDAQYIQLGFTDYTLQSQATSSVRFL